VIPSWRASRAVLTLCAIAAALVIAGCGADGGKVERGDVPALADVSRRLNASIDGSERIRARATVQIRYTDDDGTRRFEQGEGLFRMDGSLVALSVGKVGETLFWLGCDDRRYWWFDLSGDTRTAYVGLHDGPGVGRGGIAGAVNPRALPWLMGRVPVEGTGACQWSSDGRLLGVTTRLASGFERRWIDPATYETRKVELYDDQRRAVLVADLSRYEFMTLTGRGGPGPRVPTQVFIGHPATGTELRLYLEDPDDGARAMDPAAFDFIKLSASLRATRTVDLDAEAGRK